MKKVCAFPGCKSGSASDRKNNKLRGWQNKVMFKFPRTDKFPEIRKEWEGCIGRKATDTDVLCELHFHKEDIERYHETVLANGTVHRFDRGRTSLRPRAIPQGDRSNKENQASKPMTRLLTDCSSNKSEIQKSEQRPTVSEQSKNCDVLPLAPRSLNETYQNEGTIARSATTSTNFSQETRCLNETCDNETVPVKNISASTDSTEETPVPSRKISKSMSLSLQQLYRELKDTQLPSAWSALKLTEGGGTLLVGHFVGGRPAKKEFVIHSDGSVVVYIHKKCVYVPGIKTGTTVNTVLHNISVLTKLILCNGTTIAQRHSQCCKGFLESKQSYFKRGHIHCIPCKKMNAKLARKERMEMAKAKKTGSKLQKRREQVKGVRRTNNILKDKIRMYKMEIAKWKQRCRQITDTALKEAIATLPQEQQEAVTACFQAAKVKSRGRRYSKEWVYECLLMRIKSRKLYEHIRSHNILPLPDIETLNKWLKGMGSAYGFNPVVFNMLSEKAKDMEPAEKRGILLVDEMKLSEAIKLNRNTMQFDGFVNLGDYTPEHQQKKIGDHALVLMFQPFRGTWVQAVATFLSKGCADSNVLHSIILECIMHLEESGFKCDGVTTDGATWNRSMWKKWGVDGTNVSCTHPCNPERQLFFFSDFPHLIKTFRNSIIAEHEFWTPDGIVKRKHWEAVLECENHPYALKIAHKLTPDHLNPKYYQKMNVPLAFQLFDERVAAAMEIYRPYHANLVDCQPTVDFIRRIHQLIKAMMSRTPRDALRQNSDQEIAIVEFLEYLHEWSHKATTEHYTYITDSTNYGLDITLRATLKILQFLTFECNYLYIMTSRLNQDALERFFGLARNVCGANDHPDAILFGQMFRLMSTYSLVKPPKGSNVSGGDKLQSLLNFSNIPGSRSGRMEWTKIMDSVIEHGNEEINISNITDTEVQLQQREQQEKQDISKPLMEYMAGYVVRNPKKWTKCENCITSLLAEANHEKHKLIDILNKGNLTEPSFSLIKLIALIEETVLTIVDTHSITADTVFHISYALHEKQSEIPLVGCNLHQTDLTTSILSFYVIIRAEFLAKQHTSEHCQMQKQKSRRSRKDAKI